MTRDPIDYVRLAQTFAFQQARRDAYEAINEETGFETNFFVAALDAWLYERGDERWHDVDELLAAMRRFDRWLDELLQDCRE